MSCKCSISVSLSFNYLFSFFQLILVPVVFALDLKPASLCPLEQDMAQRTCRSVYRAAANVAHEERHLKRSQKCLRFTLVLGVIGLLAAILIQRGY